MTQRQEVSKCCWKKMAPIDFLVFLELTSPRDLSVVWYVGLASDGFGMAFIVDLICASFHTR